MRLIALASAVVVGLLLLANAIRDVPRPVAIALMVTFMLGVWRATARLRRKSRGAYDGVVPPDRHYVVAVTGVDGQQSEQIERFADVRSVSERLTALESIDHVICAISVTDRAMPRSVLKRVAGVNPTEPLVSLEKHGAYATLTLFDEYGSEYRALRESASVSMGAGGKDLTDNNRYLVASAVSFAAAREFVESGARPSSLNYDYVR
jgi:hypothetical protein